MPTGARWVSFEMNLDQRARPLHDPFVPADPANTSNWSTVLLVDVADESQLFTDGYFVVVDTLVWDYHLMAGLTGTWLEVGSGRLSFNDDGSLKTWAEFLPFHLPVGPQGQWEPVALDFGASTDSGASGLTGVVSRREESAVHQLTAGSVEPGDDCLTLELPKPDQVLGL